MINANHSNQIAILIDYENISISYERKYGTEGRIKWKKILETAVQYGRVAIRRAYADWSEYKGAQRELLSLGFELINVPSKKGGKNAADIKMVIDALETFIIKDSTISHVLLMSGDSDFTDLVHYLRARGMFVIGMGIEGTIAEYLINACDKYNYYDLLHKHEVANAEAVSEPELKVNGADVSEARQLLRQVMHIIGSAWVDGATLKGKILSLKPDFDELRYGFPRFKDFLDSQPDIVETRSNAKGGHLEIRSRQNGASTEAVDASEALVDRYLSILRRNNVSITPNEHRQLIIRESYSIFRKSNWHGFPQTREEICSFFDEKYPEIALGHVLDALYQIPHASCLEWELSEGAYPAETPLWQRKARLKEGIKSADELLARIDEYLITLIGRNIQPDQVDLEVLSRILYGKKRKAEVISYISALVEKRTATPPSVLINP